MVSKKSRPLDDPPSATSSEEEESSSSEDEEEVPQKSQSKPPPKKPQQSQQPESESEEEESEDEDEEEEQKQKQKEHQQEEEESDEDEDEEEQEQQQTKKTQKVKENQTPPKISTNPKKTPQPEPGSDTEPDSPKPSDFTIKPIKNDDKPSTPSKPSSKRRSENNPKNPKSSKKAKTTEEDEDANGGAMNQTPTAEKKSFVHRLWSEEDEIAILKGLIEFHSTTNKDPHAHQQEFFEFVKKSIRADVSRTQLMDKVRRLKSKFKTNVERSSEPVFAKVHEEKCFELSKKIWGDLVEDHAEKPDMKKVEKSSGRSSRKSGNDKLAIEVKPKADGNANANANANADGDVGGSNEKDLVKGDLEKDEGDLGKLYPHLMGAFRSDCESNGSVLEIVKGNLGLVESSVLKEMESKWNRQNIAEVEVFMGRIDLLHEQTRMVLDAMKSKY